MLKKDQKTEDIKKKIVKEVNDKVKKEIFPENIISRGAEFIYTGIPVGHAVNSIVDGNTVMKMPNAQVVGNSNVPMVYLNGETVPYGYASPGNDIKVLEIFEGMLLVLVPVGNGPTGDGQWTIGYFDTSVLGNTVEINYNTITWNDASNKTVVDGNGNFMYSLPADQIIQFLYETPNGNYACILFNGADGELLTGYVPMSDGIFYRYDYLRTGSLQAPGIANNTPTSSPSSSGSGSSNTPSSTSQYLYGMDISSYFEGQVANMCNYFSQQGTPLSIAQVELTCGTTNQLNDAHNIQAVIQDVKSNGLNLGYYAYLYPYASHYYTVEEQANAFVEAYNQVQNSLGITPDCQIMIDIEQGAFSALGVEPTEELVADMVNSFITTVNNQLGSQEYVVYSSASFISSYFGAIDTSECGVIVSSVQTKNNIPMDDITYPESNYTPIDYSNYPNNWGNDWTGVQFAYGAEQDYDIYTSDILTNN